MVTLPQQSYLVGLSLEYRRTEGVVAYDRYDLVQLIDDNIRELRNQKEHEAELIDQAIQTLTDFKGMLHKGQYVAKTP